VTDVIPTSFGQPPQANITEQLPGDLQADITRAKAEIAGPVPLITDSPDCTVDLPLGVAYGGARQRMAIVRELTGADEEALAKIKRPEEVFDAVLTHGVERIGALMLTQVAWAERQHYLRSLLIGERDILFVNIARVTYGDDKRYPEVVCDLCQRKQDVLLKISEEFKPKEVDFDSPCEYTTSRGLRLEYKLATGADQLEALSGESPNPAEINTRMLAQCIKTIDGGMVVDPINFARSLSIRDRGALLNVLVDRQPSVDLTVKYKCFGCNEERSLALGWLDLFRTE
jgi:hypothetical protein